MTEKRMDRHGSVSREWLMKNLMFEPDRVLVRSAPGAEHHEITPNEYQRETLRTASGMNGGDDKNMLLLMGVMGMCGESGEAIDLVKKALFQGHELDERHLALELGDVAYYVAVAAHAIGYTFEEVLQMNMEKLRKRYPNGFEVKRSVHREKGDV